MGDAAGYAFLSMEQVIADSGLAPEQVSNVRTGIIATRRRLRQPLRRQTFFVIGPPSCRALSRNTDHGQYRIGLLGYALPD